MHQARTRLILLVLVVVSAVGAALVLPMFPDRAATSPDGAFIARTHMPGYAFFVGRMPGQGGDKPGRVTIYDKDGRSCGSAPIEMVSLVYDIRWRLDEKPRRADLVARASWDLDACRLMESNR